MVRCLALGCVLLLVSMTCALDGVVGAVYASERSASRGDTLLQWDDGTPGPPGSAIDGTESRGLAVLFIAPPGAVAVTEIRLYVEPGSCVEIPEDPTPRWFRVSVWRPNMGSPPKPYERVGLPTQTGEDYPWEAWLSVPLTVPLGIGDEQQFPDGLFFAVVEQVYCEPFVGVDADTPTMGMSRVRWFGNLTWDVYSSDLMIRAVVTDSLGTAVEARTWGSIKEEYR
jgi:hypothetical protein